MSDAKKSPRACNPANVASLFLPLQQLRRREITLSTFYSTGNRLLKLMVLCSSLRSSQTGGNRLLVVLCSSQTGGNRLLKLVVHFTQQVIESSNWWYSRTYNWLSNGLCSRGKLLHLNLEEMLPLRIAFTSAGCLN
jgi:hypothetical protein